MNRYFSPYITCRGPSMFPALRDGDGLVLRKCAGPADLRRGDIIVFPHPREPYDAAHRVVRLSAAGVLTRGDNNDRSDLDTIPWPMIQGKVILVKRGAQSFSPASGRRGRVVHIIGLARMYARRLAAPILHSASGLIARTGVFRYLQPRIPIRVVSFGRDDGSSFILRYRDKTVGRKSSGTGDRWVIRFPYRFIFDRNKLP